MSTYYLHTDNYPIVIAQAEALHAAIDKIATVLVDKGFDDIREDGSAFDVQELEYDEETIVLEVA